MFGHHKDRHPYSLFAGNKGFIAGPAFRGFGYLSLRTVETHDPSVKKEGADKPKKIEEKTATEVRDQYIINYCCHQQLIDEFTLENIESLRKKINDLPVLVTPKKYYANSSYENIPESKGNNLFYLIIFNADLTDKAKKELLEVLIFDRGYDKWAIQLFHNPFYRKMLENSFCFQVLEETYIKKYVKTNFLPKNTENHFLLHCFQNSTLRPVDFYKMQKDCNKKFQLLFNWINSQTHALDIITIYNTIRHGDFELSNDHLKCFLKIAKQKILDLKIKNSNMNYHDEAQIRDFLDINRNRWVSCFTCFFTRRSVAIHGMIQNGNIAQATEAWNHEEKTLNNFYSQYGLR